MNFIDLCSVSNISVFILDQAHHGFYLHGRSPHGMTDVNIKDMIMNLDRESRLLSGTRGLEVNSTEQIFIMKITKSFRKEYDLLFRKYYVKFGFVFFDQSILFLFVKGLCSNTRTTTWKYRTIYRRSLAIISNIERIFMCIHWSFSADISVYDSKSIFYRETSQLRIQSHSTNANSRIFWKFIFCWYVRNFFLFFGIFISFTWIDNEKIFTEILFYGEENTLFMWNLITFIFIDFLSSNYILAAVLTYLLNQVRICHLSY